MHARGYETVSTRVRSGAMILSKLGIPPGRHAFDIIAVGLVTGLLDRLLSRGEYEKVIHCDTCTHTQGKEKRERLKEKKFTYQNLLVSFSLSYVWVERTSLQFKKLQLHTHTQ